MSVEGATTREGIDGQASYEIKEENAEFAAARASAVMSGWGEPYTIQMPTFQRDGRPGGGRNGSVKVEYPERSHAVGWCGNVCARQRGRASRYWRVVN